MLIALRVLCRSAQLIQIVNRYHVINRTMSRFGLLEEPTSILTHLTSIQCVESTHQTILNQLLLSIQLQVHCRYHISYISIVNYYYLVSLQVQFNHHLYSFYSPVTLQLLSNYFPMDNRNFTLIIISLMEKEVLSSKNQGNGQ